MTLVREYDCLCGYDPNLGSLKDYLGSIWRGQSWKLSSWSTQVSLLIAFDEKMSYYLYVDMFDVL